VARRTTATRDKGAPRKVAVSRREAVAGRRAPSGEAHRPGPAPSKRYTPPIPRSKRHSPKWMLGVIGVFLVLGLALIVLNYMTVLPDSPTNWYLLGGLVSIAVAFVIGTQYH
jgi:anti-sigma factor RsiW